MCSSSCCECCGFTSLIGVVFFGITAAMVQRQNTVFLTHKAGIDLHDITEEKVHQKLVMMLYMSAVSLIHSQHLQKRKKMPQSSLLARASSYWRGNGNLTNPL